MASLDHILSPLRGGSKTDPANFQWVTKDVNWAKSKLTHDEFVSLCRKVVRC